MTAKCFYLVNILEKDNKVKYFRLGKIFCLIVICLSIKLQVVFTELVYLKSESCLLIIVSFNWSQRRYYSFGQSKAIQRSTPHNTYTVASASSASMCPLLEYFCFGFLWKLFFYSCYTKEVCNNLVIAFQNIFCFPPCQANMFFLGPILT